MFALDPGTTGPALRAWVQSHAPASSLKGIVIMSPHWMTHGIGVMAAREPKTLHDFGGFPDALYQLQYPVKGDPELARRVCALMQKADLACAEDLERPLDHGAWIPLRHLYPEANVPVVQLSLPAYSQPSDIYAMGQALAPLRQQGILVIGSGGMTHNLRELRREQGPTEPYVVDFCAWVENTLQCRDLSAMLDYRVRAPGAVRAHPTDEHFLPIFFALGAAGWGPASDVMPQYISHEVIYGSLSMDAFSFS